MKYLVYYEGSGEGCDYTIGCNHAVRIINAESMESAVNKITDSFLGYPEGRDSWFDPEDLDNATIYEIAQTSPIDLDHINELRWTQAATAEKEQRERAELATYERLRAKFKQV